jgi:hypothetical protein
VRRRTLFVAERGLSSAQSHDAVRHELFQQRQRGAASACGPNAEGIEAMPLCIATRHAGLRPVVTVRMSDRIALRRQLH